MSSALNVATRVKMAVVVALAAVAFANFAAADVPPAERAALVAFFNSTGGHSWTHNTNWLKGDPCQNNWVGVVCQQVAPRSGSQAVDHVYRLQLAQNNLVGQLPENFGDLTQVEWLALDIFNQLSGPLPASIGKMTQVSLFTIAGSGAGLPGDKLSGMIPEGICNMKDLGIFHAGDNEFTGVPDCFCNLQISNCDLSGNPLRCAHTPDCAKKMCQATCT